LESTIVDLRDPRRPVLLRPGAITRAEIARALGVPVSKPAKSRGKGGPQVAPGQMPRHYSPRTPVALHSRMTQAMVEKGGPGDAWLHISRPRGARRKNVFWLGGKGDLKGAARRLFATLRRLDEAGFARIHVQVPRGPGIAEALRDRLSRASARG
jgi:L-threonylcarbamoyladenylate synthase